MEIERKDKHKEDDSLYFKDLNYGDTFIYASKYNTDPIVYMKCFCAMYRSEWNVVRLWDGYLSHAKEDLCVKKVNSKLVYSLEEGDE